MEQNTATDDNVPDELDQNVHDDNGSLQQPLISKNSAAKRTQETYSKLSKAHIEQYSRQLLLSNGFGVQGQLQLLNAAVLVIGAGGIGSTLLLYLAASGVGCISIVDHDVVEASNLHRQVIHKHHNVGKNKAESACQAVTELNPFIQAIAITEPLTHKNALELVQQYDCVVDASDNPKTRFLLNDACVLADKPLVSGSAIGTEGQLSVYNYMGGPCYRCLYPKADLTAGCHSCSDAGVLGTVPGLIGILQATEVIKVLTNIGSTMHDRLLLYDSLQCSFYNMKKPCRQNRPDCPVCGNTPTICSMQDSNLDLALARGPSAIGLDSTMTCPNPSAPLPTNASVTCREYHATRQDDVPHLLLDVRVKAQFDMCALPGAINIPLSDLPNQLDVVHQLSQDGNLPIYCICRRGIASTEATTLLLSSLNQIPPSKGDTDSRTVPPSYIVKNIMGGLNAWHCQVDPEFPFY